GKSIKKITAIKSSFKKELLFFSFPLMISGGLAILMNNFDTIMIGYFLESTDVGIYNVAYKLAGFMLIPLSFLGYIYFPLCSKLLKENKVKELKKLLPLINKWGAVSVFPLIFLFLVYPTQVISAIFGNEYIGAKYALQILTLGYLVHLLNGKTGETLKSGGYTKVILWAALLSVVVNIFLNILLIPLLGIEGAAIATGASFFSIGIIYIFAVERYMGISPFSKKYTLNCFLALVSGISVVLLYNNIPISFRFLSLVTSVLLFTIFYLLLNVITKNFEREDIFLVEMLENKTHLDLGWLKRKIIKFGGDE
ncbi:MAG: oligosaccharide flippase family protein, partial [Promethearchaeota archaeon]